MRLGAHAAPVAVLLVLLGLASAPAAARPNFIVILADDLGWSSLSTSLDGARPDARSDFHETPNIDALVQGGMRFSSAYAGAPVCSPTRYSIQFGKTPARLRRTRSEKKNLVDHDQTSVAQLLKAIDPLYRTAHLGKWHIDMDPAALGYDVHDGVTNNRTGGFVNDATQWHGSVDPDPKRVDSLTARAIEFMTQARADGRPFFLQISHYAVHSNIEYSASTFARFSERAPGELHSDVGYAAMLLDLDQSVGALMRAHAALGLTNDTYVVFLSDNGGMPVLPMQVNKGRPYRRGLNSPLLRGKWDLAEGGIRVPFAIVGPDVVAGSQSDTPVASWDLLPTIADLAGGDVPLPEHLDGGSLRPLFADPARAVSRPETGLVFHYPHYNRVGLNEPHSAIRVGDYKLLRFPVSKRSLLFDVRVDPGERADLSASDPERAARLEAALSDYLDRVGAERPEDGSKWESVGRSGKVRTRFFERYD